MSHIPPLQIVGWQEWVTFPEWKGAKMKAKLDTGARSSAIHADEYEVIRKPATSHRPLNEELRFKIQVGKVAHKKSLWVTAPIVDYRNVKNSGGEIEERPFIQTTIHIAGHDHPIILSVTNRELLRYPVLLGRTFLGGQFLVDSGSKNLLRRKKA